MTSDEPRPAPLQPTEPATQRPTLFERIGGPPVVRRVVDEFYDRVERDSVLRPIFPDDLGPGREKQRLFLEQWLGGEPLYSTRYGHPRLRRRHFPFVIDERAAGRWLRLMAQALRAAGVPEPETAEILEGLGPLAHHMVNAEQPVPREPLGDAWLE
jgi:hemoglobin